MNIKSAAAVTATTLGAVLACTLVGAAPAQAEADHQHTGGAPLIVLEVASDDDDWPWGVVSRLF
jgi:hypothetical protein